MWVLCLLPAADLAWRAVRGGLTANPIEFITLRTGYWALVLLMATLAVTPLRRLTGYNRLARFRRPLGLFAFFYATLHFLTYISLDRFFDFRDIGDDILKRPYITVGFAAFLALVPLAVTSTQGWIRRLGRNWTRVHRLVYAAAALGVLHFYWKKSAKADISEPIIFAFVLAGLLLVRVLSRPSRRPRTSRQDGDV
ncbi:MAG TPA: protein-methionine-sulfoxide reductase heme-binding subunit MsrQ [Longimicrobiales bacterium]|nr:protein-methionine-sulfoxide reductase heme-binding subunit MsrQ [Longimicrobiales bacterium]